MPSAIEKNAVTTEKRDDDQVLFRFALQTHDQTYGQEIPREHVIDVGIIYTVAALSIIGWGNEERGIEAVKTYLGKLQENREELLEIIQKNQGLNKKNILLMKIGAANVIDSLRRSRQT